MILIGCGDQVKYVYNILYDTWDHLGINSIEEVYDPIGKKVGEYVLGHKVKKYISTDISLKGFMICLTDNNLKKDIFLELESRNCWTQSIISKHVYISKFALVDEVGTIINPNVTIQPQAKIGKCCMIHSKVLIEHDCVIGDFCNIAPGVTLCGHVKVGECSTIYAGTTIIPGVSIGSNTIVGAGSLVLADVPDNVVVYGSPIKAIKNND